jgi:hypothetical protein
VPFKRGDVGEMTGEDTHWCVHFHVPDARGPII